MNVFRMFYIICKRAVKSRMFLIATAMYTICRLLDWLPEIINCSFIIDGKYTIMNNTVDMYELIGITMFGVIMLVVPVLTYSSAFCDDYSSNYLSYILVKTSKSGYCTATVMACAVSSFLCVVLGELIVSLGVSCFAQFYSVSQDTFNHALMVVSMRIILLGLQGAFYAVVTMLLSVFTNNKFIIYTTPIVLFFFFMYFGSNILKISTKINPAHIFKFFIFGEGDEIISVVYALVYLIVVMFIVIRAMEKKIERCY